MKIALNAQGTQGDVRPILALGVALRNAGHQIEFCAPENFSSLVSQYGFNFHPVGGDTQKFMEETKEQVGHPIQLAKTMALTLQAEITTQFQSLLTAVQGAHLLVSGGLDYVGRSIAEYLGIPYRFVAYCPLSFKSRYHPPITIPYQKMPGWVNGFNWWGNELIGEGMLGIKQVFNTNRKRLGLSEVAHVTDYMMEKSIVAASQVLAPMPPDIRAQYFQTGYWHLEEPSGLNQELIQFIESGEPPVYIGFGSMTDPAPAKTALTIQELIDCGSFRLLISKGWAGLGVKVSSQNVFLVENLPHVQLFPKMAAIVHHGGAGTTHTAARAGVPQLIVPHAFDQYYWGERVKILNIGPKPIPRQHLSGPNLIKTINEMLTNPAFGSNAAEIGQIENRQNGLQEALHHLETIVNKAK